MEPEIEKRLDLPGGRTMSYRAFCGGSGSAVLVLDGPGSRGLARVAAPIAGSLGLRLIAPDRPGFGDSTPDAARGIAAWPQDAEVLLDHLGIERVGILSQSGGTPYALATAAVLPGRVAALSMFGAIAPLIDRTAVKELGSQLRFAIRLARRAPWMLRALLRMSARAAEKDPEKAARRVTGNLPAADARVLEDPAMWRAHVRATQEVLSRPQAVAHEIDLFAHPWGVPIESISAPVAMWTGAEDATHGPAVAARLAARLSPRPTVTVVPDSATFGLVEIYPDALRFAAGAGSA